MVKCQHCDRMVDRLHSNVCCECADKIDREWGDRVVWDVENKERRIRELEYEVSFAATIIKRLSEITRAQMED